MRLFTAREEDREITDKTGNTRFTDLIKEALPYISIGCWLLVKRLF